MQDDKEKALENLKLINQRGAMNVFVMEFRNSPAFEDIRDDSEFQEIIGAMEAKYDPEHERIRQWMEENDHLVILARSCPPTSKWHFR